jgi:phytoene dehydrogenase-like protein
METDVVTVGAGLAGLATASFLARGGRRVIVLERASSPGGRARSTHASGFHLNLGPHALYAGGAGVRILRELGVPFSGGIPRPAGYVAVLGDAVHALPTDFVSLVATDLLRPSAKVEYARALVGLTRGDAASLMRVSLATWLGHMGLRPEVRAVIEAFVRITTYVHAPECLSAGAAIRQLRRALDRVYYLDGGWQTLVTGLEAVAQASGVTIVCGARATRVAHADGEVHGVELGDGSFIRARDVVIAAGPPDVRALIDDDSFERTLTPVRLACLDLGLAALPNRRRIVALGIDRPLYLSVHSQAAKLAPAGGAAVHVARYLAQGEAARSDAVEAELEAYADLVQPGWREQVVERRFLPSMVVTHALVEAGEGGRRPEPTVPGFRGLHVVGDWVGPEGMLADAALASARTVARDILSAERGRAASSRSAATAE